MTGVSTENFNNNCMYNLCGSLMGFGGTTLGKFHAGVDMQHGGTIRAPFTGVLVANGGTFGMAALYNQSNNVTFIFLHMTSITTAAIGSVISKGTYIGTESNIGTAGNHLHVEVHSGRVTNYAVATPSSNIPLGKDSNGNGHEVIVPYVYMGSCLNWQ